VSDSGVKWSISREFIPHFANGGALRHELISDRLGPYWAPADKLAMPFGPDRHGRENRIAFTFRLELKDGTPAEPPTFSTAVPNWRRDDVIPLGRDQALRVIDRRPAQEPDGDPVLVVEAT
jgi:hypothetical protein